MNYEQTNEKMNQLRDKIVLPALREVFQHGDFIKIEDLFKSAEAMALDRSYGIDLFFHEPGVDLKGIALRIQEGKSWDTFTVRHSRESGADTELAKRARAIKDGELYPRGTVQAYVQGNRYRMALVSTRDLITYILAGGDYTIRHNKQEAGREVVFYAVSWSDMKMAGYNVLIREGEIID